MVFVTFPLHPAFFRSLDRLVGKSRAMLRALEICS
jgi:hypothetical protein